MGKYVVTGVAGFIASRVCEDLLNDGHSVIGIDNFDPVYDLGKLKSLRSRSAVYIHGHSAGGTNPSLVEAMHFGVPIIAFDCDFNRSTTEDKALFFRDADSLQQTLVSLTEDY